MAKFSNLSHINMCNLKRFSFEYRVQTDLLNILLLVSWILACSTLSQHQTQSILQITFKMIKAGIIWHQLKKKNLNKKDQDFFPKKMGKMKKNIYSYVTISSLQKNSQIKINILFYYLFCFKITQRWNYINFYK